MTDEYFFDTDCLSAFLWVNGESILSKLYAGHIVLPAQVYDEIKRVPHLCDKVDIMKDQHDLVIKAMEAGSTEYLDYLKMTTNPEKGMRIIGKGEAAGIAMVKERDGILASNNLRDIAPYVEKFNLKHITTGDILIKAMDMQMITADQGDDLWQKMLKKRRKLPTSTFFEYLKEKDYL